jgi:hypothetical protein
MGHESGARRVASTRTSVVLPANLGILLSPSAVIPAVGWEAEHSLGQQGRGVGVVPGQ